MNYDPAKYPKCTVPQAEVTRLKGLGFLRDKTTADCFNVRVITANGKITSEEMNAISEAAKQFGDGEIAMTVRLTCEIQRVPYANAEALIAFLKERGLETGGTGAKVRPVVSCKGTTCQYGLIDTFALSKKLHTLFYEGYRSVALPHKFKIAVGGCPNNCVKPDLNDIGIVGQRTPVPMPEVCRGCNACVKECPIHSASLVEKKFVRDDKTCNNCGRCVKVCPFHAIDCVDGYKIYIGGRWGKRVAQGKALSVLLHSEEEVVKTVEKAILFFKAYGNKGERFADVIARIGFEETEKILLSDELLAKKEEILAL